MLWESCLMSAKQMNEYLLKLTMRHQPDPDEIGVTDEERTDLRVKYHEECKENSCEMLSKTTQWAMENRLLDDFQSVSVAEMHKPNYSWLVLQSTEELSNKLQDAFPDKIKDKVFLGKAPKKGYTL